MALETGGLDAQVEQRMDAYRGNPQQLQQRYGVNKDLMDLLALQQIKKDKEAVVADMQLKMQQQPGTIAQQREQEVLALTKQEMSGTLGQLAANTKGTLDQKQSLQNKNMNKMAQNASKPQLGAGAGLAGLMGGGARPQARPPQGGGVEGMLMARNAQRGAPVRRMAQGGIVSFSGGEEVKVGEAVRKRIAELGINVEQFAAMSETQRKSILDSINDRSALGQFGSGMERIPAALLDKLVRTPVAMLKNLGLDFAESRVGSALGLSDPEDAPAERAPMFPTQDRITADIEANQAGLDESGLKSLLPVVSPSVTTPEITAADPGDTDPLNTPPEYEVDPYKTQMSQVDMNDLFPDAIDPGKADTAGVDAATQTLLDSVGQTPEAITPNKIGRAGLEPIPAADYMNETGLMARDQLLNRAGKDFDTNVNSAISGARESADAYTMRDAKNTMYREQGAKEQAYQDRMLDPKRVEQLKRMETYGGGAKYGRGGIGQGFVESERRFDELEGGGLKTLRGIQDNAIANDFNMAGFGMAAGSRAGSRAQADKNNAGIIYQNEITRQQGMAKADQAARQAINTADTTALNSAQLAAYNAKVSAFRDEVSANQTVLNAEGTKLSAEAKRLTQLSANQQAVELRRTDGKIQQIRDSDAFALKKAEIQRLDRNTASAELSALQTLLSEQIDETLRTDENYAMLLEEVAKTKQTPKQKAAVERAEIYRNMLIKQVADVSTLSYARLAEYRERIEFLDRNNILNPTGVSTAIDEDDPNVTVDPVE